MAHPADLLSFDLEDALVLGLILFSSIILSIYVENKRNI